MSQGLSSAGELASKFPTNRETIQRVSSELLLCWVFFFFKDFFFLFERSNDRQEEMDKEVIHFLVHSPIDCDTRGAARPKSGTWDSHGG